MAIGIFGQYDEDEEDRPKFDPMNPYGSPLAPKPPVDPTQPPMQQGPRPYQGPPTQPWWQQQKPPQQPPPPPPQQPQPFNPEVPMAKGGPLPAFPPPTQPGPPGVVPPNNMDLPIDQRKPEPLQSIPLTPEEADESMRKSVLFGGKPAPLPPHNPMSNRRPIGTTPDGNTRFSDGSSTMVYTPKTKELSDAARANFRPGLQPGDTPLDERAEMAKRGIAPPGPINPTGRMVSQKSKTGDGYDLPDRPEDPAAAGWVKDSNQNWHPNPGPIKFDDPRYKNKGTKYFYGKNLPPIEQRDFITPAEDDAKRKDELGGDWDQKTDEQWERTANDIAASKNHDVYIHHTEDPETNMKAINFLNKLDAQGKPWENLPPSQKTPEMRHAEKMYNLKSNIVRNSMHFGDEKSPRYQEYIKQHPEYEDIIWNYQKNNQQPLFLPIGGGTSSPRGGRGVVPFGGGRVPARDKMLHGGLERGAPQAAFDMSEAKKRGITPPPYARRPGQIIEDPSRKPAEAALSPENQADYDRAKAGGLSQDALGWMKASKLAEQRGRIYRDDRNAILPDIPYAEKRPGEKPWTISEIDRMDIPIKQKHKLNEMAEWKYIPTEEEQSAWHKQQEISNYKHPSRPSFEVPPWIDEDKFLGGSWRGGVPRGARRNEVPV